MQYSLAGMITCEKNLVQNLPENVPVQEDITSMVGHTMARYSRFEESIAADYINKLKFIDIHCKERIFRVGSDLSFQYYEQLNKIPVLLDVLKSAKSFEDYQNILNEIILLMDSLFDIIDKYKIKLHAIEVERLGEIKHTLQNYFKLMTTKTLCSRGALKDFLAKEIYFLNVCLLSNQIYLTGFIYHIKLEACKVFQNAYQSWMLRLLKWRDILIKNSCESVQQLTGITTELIPDEVLCCREKTETSLEGFMRSIMSIIMGLLENTPFTESLVMDTFAVIDKMFLSLPEAVYVFDRYVKNVYADKLLVITEHVEEIKKCLELSKIESTDHLIYVLNFVRSICNQYERNFDAYRTESKESFTRIVNFNQDKIFQLQRYLIKISYCWNNHTEILKKATDWLTDRIECQQRSNHFTLKATEEALDVLCKQLLTTPSFAKLEKVWLDVENQVDTLKLLIDKNKADMNAVIILQQRNALQAKDMLILKLLDSLQVIESSEHGDGLDMDFLYRNYRVNENENTHIAYKEISLVAKSVLKKVLKHNELHSRSAIFAVQNKFKEFKNEMNLRYEFHSPRLMYLKERFYEVRIGQFQSFVDKVNTFVTEVKSFEASLSMSTKEIQLLKANIKSNCSKELSALDDLLCKASLSADAMIIRMQLVSVCTKYSRKLYTEISEQYIRMANNRDEVEKRRDEILKFAENNLINFSDMSDLYKNFKTYSKHLNAIMLPESGDNDVLETIEKTKGEVVVSFKRNLFAIFYLELKNAILQKMKGFVRASAVDCARHVQKADIFTKAIIPHKNKLSFSEMNASLWRIVTLYKDVNELLEQLSFSSNTPYYISNCRSQTNLDKKYSSFLKGDDFQNDCKFVKDIYAITGKSRSNREQPKQHITSRCEWRVSRATVISNFIIGKLKARYGVNLVLANEVPEFSATSDWIKSAKRHASMHVFKEHDIPPPSLRRASSLHIPVLPLSSSSPNLGLNILSAQVSTAFSVKKKTNEKMILQTMQDALDHIRSQTSITRSKPMKRVQIYELTLISDEMMKSMIFSPLTFFSLPHRNYDVTEYCKYIPSVFEKTKFMIRHGLEDYIVSTEIFFRQKNLKITNKNINKDPEECIGVVARELESYLDEITAFCHNNVSRVRKMIIEINNHQLNLCSQYFNEILHDATLSFKQLLHNYDNNVRQLNAVREEEKVELFEKICSAMHHPNRHRELFSHRETEESMNKSFLEELISLKEECLKKFQKVRTENVKKVRKLKLPLSRIIHNMIPEDVIGKINACHQGRLVNGKYHVDCLNRYHDSEFRQMYRHFDTSRTVTRGDTITLTPLKYSDFVMKSADECKSKLDEALLSYNDKVNVHYQAEIKSAARWIEKWDNNITNIVELCKH